MTSIDIYNILSQKPHNPHYLKRYWKFILGCQEKNRDLPKDTYTENHHICPKAKDLFPEYSSFTDYVWNKAKLTARQHFIAHVILYKAYQTKSTLFSLNMMLCLNKNNSKIYEFAKIQTRKLHSQNLKNKFKEENFRKIHKEKMKEYYSREENKQKQSNMLKKKWQEENYIEKQKEASLRKDTHEKRSSAKKKLWEDKNSKYRREGFLDQRGSKISQSKKNKIQVFLKYKQTLKYIDEKDFNIELHERAKQAVVFIDNKWVAKYVPESKINGIDCISCNFNKSKKLIESLEK